MSTRFRAAVLATLAGCGGSLLESVAEPAIRTDQSEYRLRQTALGLETQILFTFRNRTGGAVYVPNCRGDAPPVLEKLVDGEWVRAWAPVILLCLSPPIVIQAGARHADTLRVLGCHPQNNCAPKFEVAEVEGTYRLLWPHVLTSYDDRRHPFGDPLPVGERISNTFVLER